MVRAKIHSPSYGKRFNSSQLQITYIAWSVSWWKTLSWKSFTWYTYIRVQRLILFSQVQNFMFECSENITGFTFIFLWVWTPNWSFKNVHTIVSCYKFGQTWIPWSLSWPVTKIWAWCFEGKLFKMATEGGMTDPSNHPRGRSTLVTPTKL